MFEHLDKSKVPQGLLRDYAFEMADLDIYNGKELNDSNYVNKIAFENLLRTISSASVTPDTFDPEDILHKQNMMNQPNCGIIGIVLYQYSYIKANALSDNLIKYENGQVYDNTINGVWQNPYDTEYTFGFSAQDTILQGSIFNYIFPDEIWKSNQTPRAVYFDAGDGKGYQQIAKGQTLQAFYSTSGVKHLKMKAEISNNTSLYAHSLIKILVDGTHTRSMAKIPNPDFTEDIIAEEDYNGVKAQGRISYLYSSKNKGKLTRPFIIIEGFDPLELVSNANIQMNDRKYGLNSIKTFLYYWYNINYNKYMSLLTEYDVIYIDIFDSKLNIQANAKMFERAIEIINQRKRIDGCTEKNIVFAQSMGGLIARYGLKEMESNNKKHETSVLFCHDTPHLGAHIPLGLLHGVHGIFKFYSKLSLRRLKIKDLQPMIGPVLYSDAAKQMLINYVDENGYLNNSCHEVWQKELSKIGYPQGDDGYKMRILGISNGQTVPIEQQKPYLYVNGKMSLRTLTDIILQYPLLSGLVSGVSGILTKDWQTFLLNLLPGSSTYKLYFEARPPFRGPVCDISLRYVKKYLWTIPIKRTIFSHTSYFPENMIPYDNMPGSYYQLEKKIFPRMILIPSPSGPKFS